MVQRYGLRNRTHIITQLKWNFCWLPDRKAYKRVKKPFIFTLRDQIQFGLRRILVWRNKILERNPQRISKYSGGNIDDGRRMILVHIDLQIYTLSEISLWQPRGIQRRCMNVMSYFMLKPLKNYFLLRYQNYRILSTRCAEYSWKRNNTVGRVLTMLSWLTINKACLIFPRMIPNNDTNASVCYLVLGCCFYGRVELNFTKPYRQSSLILWKLERNILRKLFHLLIQHR